MFLPLHFLVLLSVVLASQLTVDVKASWQRPPFLVSLVESGSYNASLYRTILDAYTEESTIDSELYEKVTLSLLEPEKSFLDLHLANKIYGPRIAAHYHYFNSEVVSKYQEKVEKKCATDSFGSQLDNVFNTAWLLYEDKIYCSGDELFALQLNKKKSVELLAQDRIIGSNENAPIVIFYGDGVSDSFHGMFSTLYSEADNGKLRFVWRYIPPQTDTDTLSGYGVDLSVKRTDYLTTDSSVAPESELKPVAKEEVSLLGLKLTSHVVSKDYDTLRTILEDFPLYSHYISKLKVNSEVEKVVENNKKVGASKDSNGIYVNGALIHPLKFDLHVLIDKIQKEYELIEELKSYGFTVPQAKKLITKFALLSAVKESQFRNGNTLMGNNENRFKLFEHEFQPKAENRGGVLFFNNIEQDDTYQQYSESRKDTYLGAAVANMPKGQLPPLKENIHDLIFAINLGSREQLKVFFTIAKFFLDRGIPKQIGLLPLTGDDPRDEKLAQLFYFLAEHGDSKESLALLYKYFESSTAEEEEAVFASVKIPDIGKSYGEHEYTSRKFSITVPSVIVNGVIHDLKSTTWQSDMRSQIAQDVRLLQHHIRHGTDEGKSLKSIIYESAQLERNLRVVPKDPATILYKKVTRELVDASVTFKKKVSENDISGTFTLIGDFNTAKIQDQFVEIVRAIAASKLKNSLQVRIINTSTKSSVLETLEKYADKSLDSSVAEELVAVVQKLKKTKSSLNPDIVRLIEESEIQVHYPSLLFNSRYFRLNDIFKVKELDLLVDYEFKQRLSVIKDLVQAYPDDYQAKSLFEFRTDSYDALDWFDILSSTISKSFYVDDIYLSDVSRFDFSSLDWTNAIETKKYDALREVDISVIIDPVDEYSQELVSVLQAVKDLSFVNVQILLQPSSDDELKITRFYRGVFSGAPRFENGILVESNNATFTDIPNVLLTANVIAPHKWIVTSQSAPFDLDLDNIQFSQIKDDHVSYQLKNILVEGYAHDVSLGLPTSGLELMLLRYGENSDTSVMSSFGYFQLQANPGVWDLVIKPNTKSTKHCSLLSADGNKYIANDQPIESAQISVLDLKGKELNLRVKKNPGYETKNLLLDDYKPKKSASHKVNIFTIASGHLYERLLSIMTISASQNTKETVKFWIIENYISPRFKKMLPLLASQYNFEYELITYKWPAWLRSQREKQRTIWGYKMLFLDVIFPQDLDRIIFVDADLVVRTDLVELAELDLEGAPYGFTPMCDSRKEMDGFRFWKEGYWTEVLQDKYKYHISALYVVDLNKFRSIAAGDRLRSHYQKLSADKNSLSNLDQDLPNNMQKWIKIFSLPQEWLWCETWCADDELLSAKVVDLCNNPLTKEHKVERALRQLPEWNSYDEKVAEVLKLAEEEEKKEKEEKEKKEKERQQKEQEEREKLESEEQQNHINFLEDFLFEDDDWEHDEL